MEAVLSVLTRHCGMRPDFMAWSTAFSGTRMSLPPLTRSSEDAHMGQAVLPNVVAGSSQGTGRRALVTEQDKRIYHLAQAHFGQIFPGATALQRNSMFRSTAHVHGLGIRDAGLGIAEVQAGLTQWPTSVGCADFQQFCMAREFPVGEVAGRCYGPLGPNQNSHSEQRNKHDHGAVVFLPVYPRAVPCQRFHRDTENLCPGSLNFQNGVGMQDAIRIRDSVGIRLHARTLSGPSAPAPQGGHVYLRSRTRTDAAAQAITAAPPSSVGQASFSSKSSAAQQMVSTGWTS